MMKRIYMDVTEESYLRFKAQAKADKRTMKGFLEYLFNESISKSIDRKVVKKHGKK